MVRNDRIAGFALVALALTGCATGASQTSAGSETFKASFRDCADCPDLIAILAGSFAMGRDGGEPGRWGMRD